MFEKIDVGQLKAGMYIEEFCGSWMEHPFWRNSFVVTDAHDIDRIRAGSIRQGWIDSAKGVDAAADVEMAPVWRDARSGSLPRLESAYNPCPIRGALQDRRPTVSGSESPTALT